MHRKGATLDQGRELGRGFMLNYGMYRHYFPLSAMGRARRHLEGQPTERALVTSQD